MERSRCRVTDNSDGVLKLTTIYERELHNDLVCSWNEVEETLSSLEWLSDKELLMNRDALIQRLRDTLHWLGKYVSEDDILEAL
jgi:hypothetical protein